MNSKKAFRLVAFVSLLLASQASFAISSTIMTMLLNGSLGTGMGRKVAVEASVSEYKATGAINGDLAEFIAQVRIEDPNAQAQSDAQIIEEIHGALVKIQ